MSLWASIESGISKGSGGQLYDDSSASSPGTSMLVLSAGMGAENATATIVNSAVEQFDSAVAANGPLQRAGASSLVAFMLIPGFTGDVAARNSRASLQLAFEHLEETKQLESNQHRNPNHQRFHYDCVYISDGMSPKDRCLAYYGDGSANNNSLATSAARNGTIVCKVIFVSARTFCIDVLHRRITIEHSVPCVMVLIRHSDGFYKPEDEGSFRAEREESGGAIRAGLQAHRASYVSTSSLSNSLPPIAFAFELCADAHYKQQQVFKALRLHTAANGGQSSGGTNEPAPGVRQATSFPLMRIVTDSASVAAALFASSPRRLSASYVLDKLKMDGSDSLQLFPRFRLDVIKFYEAAEKRAQQHKSNKSSSPVCSLVCRVASPPVGLDALSHSASRIAQLLVVMIEELVVYLHRDVAHAEELLATEIQKRLLARATTTDDGAPPTGIKRNPNLSYRRDRDPAIFGTADRLGSPLWDLSSHPPKAVNGKERSGLVKPTIVLSVKGIALGRLTATDVIAIAGVGRQQQQGPPIDPLIDRKVGAKAQRETTGSSVIDLDGDSDDDRHATTSSQKGQPDEEPKEASTPVKPTVAAALAQNSAHLLLELRRMAFGESVPALDHHELFKVLGVTNTYNVATFSGESPTTRNSEGDIAAESSFLSQRPTLSKMAVSLLNSILDLRDLLDMLVSNPDLPAAKFLLKLERRIYSCRVLELTYAKEMEARNAKPRRDWKFIHPSIQGSGGVALWTTSSHFPLLCQLARQRVYGVVRDAVGGDILNVDDDDDIDEPITQNGEENLLPNLAEEVGPRLMWLRRKVDEWSSGLLRRHIAIRSTNTTRGGSHQLTDSSADAPLPTLLILVQRRASEQAVTDVLVEGADTIAKRQFCSFLHEYACLYASAPPIAVVVRPGQMPQVQPALQTTNLDAPEIDFLAYWSGSAKPDGSAIAPKRTVLFGGQQPPPAPTADTVLLPPTPSAAAPKATTGTTIEVDRDEEHDMGAVLPSNKALLLSTNGSAAEDGSPNPKVSAKGKGSRQKDEVGLADSSLDLLGLPAALFGEEGEFVDWGDFDGLYSHSAGARKGEPDGSSRSKQGGKNFMHPLAMHKARTVTSERADSLREALVSLSQTSSVAPSAVSARSKPRSAASSAMRSVASSSLSSVWTIAASAASTMRSSRAPIRAGSPSGRLHPHEYLLALHDLAMVSSTETSGDLNRHLSPGGRGSKQQESAVAELLRSLVGEQQNVAQEQAADDESQIRKLEQVLFTPNATFSQQSATSEGVASPAQMLTPSRHTAIDIEEDDDGADIETTLISAVSRSVDSVATPAKSAQQPPIRFTLVSITSSERLLYVNRVTLSSGKEMLVPIGAIRIAVNAAASCSRLIHWMKSNRLSPTNDKESDATPFTGFADKCRTDKIFLFEPEPALMKAIEGAGVELSRLSDLCAQPTSRTSSESAEIEVQVFQWKKKTDATTATADTHRVKSLSGDQQFSSIAVDVDPYDLTIGMAREQLQMQKLIIAKNTVLTTHRMHVSTASKLALLRSLGKDIMTSAQPSAFTSMTASGSTVSNQQPKDTLIRRINATVKASTAAGTSTPVTVNQAWEVAHLPRTDGHANNDGADLLGVPRAPAFFMNSSVKLVLMDEREFRSNLPYELHTRGLTLLPLTLPRGDFILSPQCAIERKSFPDLAASLRNLRLSNQLTKLSEHFTHPVVLIEDSDFVGDSAASTASMPPFRFTPTQNSAESGIVYPVIMESIYKSLMRLVMLHRSVLWMWGRSPAHSATMVASLKGLDPATSANRPQQQFTGPGRVAPLSEHIASSNPDPEVCAPSGRDEGQKDAQKVAMAVLARFPGVTAANILPLMVKCRSLAGLASMSKDDLVSTFSAGGANLTENHKNAELLYRFLHNRYAF